jgi:hypothetical protein
MSTKYKSNIKYFLFILSLISYYYIFLFFPPIKEISGALNIRDFYLSLKVISMIVFLLSILFLSIPKIFVGMKYVNLYIFYSIFNIIFLIFFMKYNIKYIILSFYDTFSILFLSFLFILIDKNNITIIKIKSFLYLLSSIFIVILVYGYLQKIFNNSLLFYEHDFYYISTEIHNIRVWSILPSRIEYGKATSLVATLMVFYILFFKKTIYKVQFILLLILALIGTYISTERASLILFIISIINLILLKSKIKFSNIVILNLITSLITPVILLSLTFQFSLSDSLFRTNSLIDRVYWWGTIIQNYIINGDILNILFGYGIIQTTDANSFSASITNGKLWIDNLYFTIFLYQGVIGLVLFIYMYIKFTFKVYYLNTFYSKYFTSVLLAWLVASVFARSIGDIVLFTFLPAIIYLKYYERSQYCKLNK